MSFSVRSTRNGSRPVASRRRWLVALGLPITLIMAMVASLDATATAPPHATGIMMPVSLAAAVGTRPAVAAAVTGAALEPFTVEYYYRVRWGQQAEFLRLFRKNHLPVLEKEVKMGLMSSFSAVEPFYHANEESRWDYRVTIVYPSAAAAHGADPAADPAFRRALFPDTATFAAEERRRFELLEAHWDVPIVPLSLR